MSAGEGETKVPTDVAQVILLQRLLEKIGALDAKIDSTIPEGIVEPIRQIRATPASQTIRPPLPDKHWFSISLVNDGPSDCWVIVNSEKSTTSPYMLGLKEVYEVDMKAAKIVDIVVYTDSGVASLRIRGVR
ncbi:hypothetical protein MUP77_21650 [Candidatus Bathyarchaeota archaeon]|nr:hypothetical protein [Candidatus Bathyarchaeota archaeon]